MKSQVADDIQAYVMDMRTVTGTLWDKEGDFIRCVACGHRCLIGEGKRGICKVRFNQEGQLKVPFGYIAALQCDPVEKKPFFHVYPGSDALTFGMLGCDLHCPYCQNWLTSQALRDQAANAPMQPMTPGHLIGLALKEKARLVVSSFNDSPAELRAAARFLASISRDIPWHLTGFHKDYKMTDPEDTKAETLVRAAEIGAEEGLRFVYAGNRPGQVGAWENTRCPSCQETVIERFGFLVRGYHLTAEGCCPRCQARLPGVWPAAVEDVKTGDLSMYRTRLPRAVR